MFEDLGGGGYPTFVTPLTEPLKKGDPRAPVNNPGMMDAPDPTGILPGNMKTLRSNKKTKKGD